MSPAPRRTPDPTPWTPVRQLEHRAHGQQRDRRRNHLGPVLEDSGERVGDEPESQRREAHDGRAAGEGDETGAARPGRVSGADGPAHAHRAGHAHAHRRAEGEARERNRDLVRSGAQGAEPRGEQAHQGKDAHLRAHLQAHRNADGQGLAQIRHHQLARDARRRPHRERDHGQLHESAEARRQRGAGRAQRGKARLPKHQRDVEQEVCDVREQDRHDQSAGPLRSLQVGPQGGEGEHRQEARKPQPEKEPAVAAHLGRDAGGLEQEGQERDGQRQDQGHEERQPEPLPDELVGALAIARAQGLREEGIEAHHRPDADDGEREEEAVRRPHRAQRSRSQPAHHRRVDEAHQGIAGLREGDGEGELAGAARARLQF